MTSCGFVNKNNVSGEFAVCSFTILLHFVDCRSGVLRREQLEFLTFGRYSNCRKVQNHQTGGKIGYKLFLMMKTKRLVTQSTAVTLCVTCFNFDIYPFSIFVFFFRSSHEVAIICLNKIYDSSLS